MSHTPGPWKIAETFGDNIRIAKQVNIRPVDDRNGEHGATCCLVWGADSPECKDNAYLIAASPELLEACEKMIAAFEYQNERLVGSAYEAKQQMINVIKKARGQ